MSDDNSDTDADLEALRKQTESGDRYEEDAAAASDPTRDVADRVAARLEAIEDGEVPKTLAFRDKQMKALLGAVVDDPDAKAAAIEGLESALDRNVNPASIDQSELARLLLRAGLQAGAPDLYDALREGVAQQARDSV